MSSGSLLSSFNSEDWTPGAIEKYFNATPPPESNLSTRGETDRRVWNQESVENHRNMTLEVPHTDMEDNNSKQEQETETHTSSATPLLTVTAADKVTTEASQNSQIDRRPSLDTSSIEKLANEETTAPVRASGVLDTLLNKETLHPVKELIFVDQDIGSQKNPIDVESVSKKRKDTSKPRSSLGKRPRKVISPKKVLETPTKQSPPSRQSSRASKGQREPDPKMVSWAEAMDEDFEVKPLGKGKDRDTKPEAIEEDHSTKAEVKEKGYGTKPESKKKSRDTKPEPDGLWRVHMRFHYKWEWLQEGWMKMDWIHDINEPELKSFPSDLLAFDKAMKIAYLAANNLRQVNSEWAKNLCLAWRKVGCAFVYDRRQELRTIARTMNRILAESELDEVTERVNLVNRQIVEVEDFAETMKAFIGHIGGDARVPDHWKILKTSETEYWRDRISDSGSSSDSDDSDSSDDE